MPHIAIFHIIKLTALPHSLNSCNIFSKSNYKIYWFFRFSVCWFVNGFFLWHDNFHLRFSKNLANSKLEITVTPKLTPNELANILKCIMQVGAVLNCETWTRRRMKLYTPNEINFDHPISESEESRKKLCLRLTSAWKIV